MPACLKSARNHSHTSGCSPMPAHYRCTYWIIWLRRKVVTTNAHLLRVLFKQPALFWSAAWWEGLSSGAVLINPLLTKRGRCALSLSSISRRITSVTHSYQKRTSLYGFFLFLVVACPASMTFALVLKVKISPLWISVYFPWFRSQSLRLSLCFPRLSAQPSSVPLSFP